jgi:hypothetical protein
MHAVGLRCTSRTRPLRTSAPTTTSCIGGLEHGLSTNRTLATTAEREGCGVQAAAKTGRGPFARADGRRRVVAMGATCNQPVAEAVVFSTTWPGYGPARASPGRPRHARRIDGPEHRLLVVPADPAHLDLVRAANSRAAASSTIPMCSRPTTGSSATAANSDPERSTASPRSRNGTSSLSHFGQRTIALGSCHRPYGSSSSHEHACIRCEFLKVDPQQAGRLGDIKPTRKPSFKKPNGTSGSGTSTNSS